MQTALSYLPDQSNVQADPITWKFCSKGLQLEKISFNRKDKLFLGSYLIGGLEECHISRFLRKRNENR